MRISILPKTSLGRWSVGTAAVLFLVFLLNYLLGPNTLNVLEFKSGSIEQVILFIVLCIFGIGSLLTGFISVIKSKERSILVFLALLLGLITLFVISDIAGQIVNSDI